MIQDSPGQTPLYLIKKGRGEQVITGHNRYSGDTLVAQGVLVAGSDHALGTGVIIIEKGATLALRGHRLPNMIINHGGLLLP